MMRSDPRRHDKYGTGEPVQTEVVRVIRYFMKGNNANLKLGNIPLDWLSDEAKELGFIQWAENLSGRVLNECDAVVITRRKEDGKIVVLSVI